MNLKQSGDELSRVQLSQATTWVSQGMYHMSYCSCEREVIKTRSTVVMMVVSLPISYPTRLTSVPVRELLQEAPS